MNNMRFLSFASRDDQAEVSTADRLRLRDLAAQAGLPHALITDSGQTEFHGVPTHTVLAIGPARRSQTDPLCGPGGAVACRLA